MRSAIAINRAQLKWRHSEKGRKHLFNYKKKWRSLNKERVLLVDAIWRDKNREKINSRLRIYNKERRHRLGLSNKYREEYTGVSYTKEYKKIQRQKRKSLLKGGGELSIKTIQMVYEDNIKKYGTLTCYLCEKPIEFRDDNLEHKTPLIRGGTNEYQNLGISCQKCNNKKYIKTEEEYRKEILTI